MSDADDDAVDYALVMPFVVCESKGGPYDDDAFTAGFTAGRIDVWLKVLPTLEAIGGPFSTAEPEMVRSALVPQLDLIAMRHGYVIDAEPWAEHPDEWTAVRFRRAPAP